MISDGGVAEMKKQHIGSSADSSGKLLMKLSVGLYPITGVCRSVCRINVILPPPSHFTGGSLKCPN